jgi:hypothetical protein
MKNEFQTDTHKSRETRPSKARRRTAMVLQIVTILFLLFDALGKILRLPPVLKAAAEMGLSLGFIIGIGWVLLGITMLYIFPPTVFLGAVLLTGYLGGAIAAQLVAGHPFFESVIFPIVFAALAWGPVYLRDPGLRKRLPVTVDSSALTS